MEIDTISTKRLLQKIRENHPIKLLMTYHKPGFDLKHIPGSIHVESIEDLSGIQKDDEIIVYCINESCQASVQAYVFLKTNGFKHVKRYAGGIEAWEEAGLRLVENLLENVQS